MGDKGMIEDHWKPLANGGGWCPFYLRYPF